jgi:GAF domain-containing protein
LHPSKELEVVRAVSAIARSEEPVDAILQRALATVAAGVGAHAGEIWLLEPQTEALRLAVLHGGTPAFRERERLAVGEGLPGIALARGSELSVPDLAAEPAFVRRTIIDAGFAAFRVVPMYAGAGVAGALAVASRDAAIMSRDHGRLLSQVAGDLGIVVDNHRLREELREARERLAAVAASNALARATSDEIIQSLFGIGLRLHAGSAADADSLAETMRDMQTVIADARALIMRTEPSSGRPGLRV